MTIAPGVRRRPATAAEAESALLRLQDGAGAYFGVDAGIAGLHPLQATLIAAPALVLNVFGDGVEVRSLSAFGNCLLAQPGLDAWTAGLQRGLGVSSIQMLREFLGCFAPSPDLLLLGGLRFDAHRLVAPGNGGDLIGSLFFGERLLRRNSSGAWEELQLVLDGARTVSSAPPVREPASRAGPDRALADDHQPGDDHPPGGYAAMVRRAVELLREPTLVSLTLSQSYRRSVTLSAAQAFARLRAVNPAPASFFLNDGSGERLFGASPDLQLTVSAGRIEAFPVCGTVARRAGAVGEAESLRELLNEEVDAASLAVCTDALRNDLAALCEPGSLRLQDRRRPMSLATVIHAVDRLEGRLRPGCDAWDAIVATAAPVMVTGTPRAAALAAIAQLEASPRGWYGGLMVQVASNGDALVGTILRAAAVSNGVAEVRTGGDLMVDSSPEREEQESRLKTLSVWRAFGLEPDAQSPARPVVGGAALGLEAVAEGAAAGVSGAGPSALRLQDHGDPFGQSVRDCVLGLGIGLSDAATTTLAIGAGAALDGPTTGHVAIGDAAYEVLARNGFAVESQAPQHGRTLLATATPQAPWPNSGPFIVALYASYRLANASMPIGWETWAVDGKGTPLILVERGRRIACLLFRPDSLLCEPQALSALRASISLVGSKAGSKAG